MRSIALDLSGIHPARWALALSGLVFSALAWSHAAAPGDALGHRLLGDLNASAHCSWCYAAIAAFLAAAAPAPSELARLRRRKAPIRVSR